MIDSDLNLLFKGKVAASCNDIILCEFFFSGLISQVTDCELLSLLSVFCTNEKGGQAKDCSKQYSESFTKAIDFVYDETEKLIELETTKGIVAEGEDTVEKRLNAKFYEMVYDWADQKSFAEVTHDSEIDEGIIVKLIMSVNRKRSHLQQMATFVGDNSLAERMKSIEELINRGLVKMQSLYLEVEQEPPKLSQLLEDNAEVKYEESKN